MWRCFTLIRKQQPVAENRGMETYIGQDTRIEGTIVTSGSVRVDGEVDGDIQSQGDVIVGETGRVRAGIRAVNLIIAGEVSGEARVSGRLELLATGRMYGDAHMQTLIVEQGGVLQGNSRMGSEETPAAELVSASQED